MATQTTYVIAGAGLAGAKAAQTLREHGYGGPLTLIGDEKSSLSGAASVSAPIMRITFGLKPDAFVGAFAYGLARGLGELDAVGLGVRCASDSVQRPGTQRSFPREVALDEFLAQA